MINFITKELLEAVLKEEYNLRLVEWFDVEDNILSTYYNCGNFDEQGRPTGLGVEINIYELANKCKEWLSGEGFSLVSWVEQYPDGCSHLKHKEKGISLKFKENSEPKSIFMATQWVLAHLGVYDD